METSDHKRILLKLSGEVFAGGKPGGIDPAVLDQLAEQIISATGSGIELGLVIGGGNLFRGAALAAAGLDRVTGDHMGMLATVMNSLAMQDALARAGGHAVVMSAIPVGSMCEIFNASRARDYLDEGRIVIFSAGTGNPFFTTDTAASLRAIEIHADILFKATKVDGVYSDDPAKNPQATRYDRLSYDEVIKKRLGVMDTTAVVLCRDHGLPLRVFNMQGKGALVDALTGKAVGTIVEAKKEHD